MPLLLHLLYCQWANIPRTNPKSQPFCSPSALRPSQVVLHSSWVYPPPVCISMWGAHGAIPKCHIFFTIFWIFWSKMKVTQADATTIWMDCHPILTDWCPPLPSPPFLCWMPFLAQPSQFILAWDKHQICCLAYPMVNKLMSFSVSFYCSKFTYWTSNEVYSVSE